VVFLSSECPIPTFNYTRLLYSRQNTPRILKVPLLSPSGVHLCTDGREMEISAGIVVAPHNAYEYPDVRDFLKQAVSLFVISLCLLGRLGPLLSFALL
jgi:hypothetical protein